MGESKIVLFQSSDGEVSLPVEFGKETVWLSQAQMAQLFGKDRTVIGRHIRNAIDEGEIDPKVVCANFAHTTPHGAIKGKSQTQEVIGYNLDVVISVGYRVHSLSRRTMVSPTATSASRLDCFSSSFIATNCCSAKMARSVSPTTRSSHSRS